MTTTRQGPALAITGTCEGCAHIADDRGVPLCALRGKPQNALDRIAFSLRTDWRTPDECPLLPAARLALARSVVAEAEGTTVAALAADECPGKVRCHGAMKWCKTCGPVAGTCDDMACDQHDAAHGADR